MRKNSIFVLAMCFLLSLIASASKDDEENLPRFEQPNLITSVGQSADVQMASVLAKRAGLDATLKKTATAKDLVSEAKKRGIPILCLHLGGEARRGQLTDQLIAEFLPFSKMAIIVKSGNHDGFFSEICGENDIPLVEVEKTVDALIPLKNAFQ
jgi:hypothetical protein